MKALGLSLFLLITINLISAKETISGYYITLKNDTIKTEFLVSINLIDNTITYQKLQAGIQYLDSVQQKQTLTPQKAKGFVLFYMKDTIIFLSKYVDLTKLGGTLVEDQGYLFLKLEENGYNKLFRFFADARGQRVGSIGVKPNDDFDYCLQKGNEPIIGIGMLSRKDFSLYYSDYPSLSKKIESKEYKKNDIKKIVCEYNLWYRENHHN